MPRTYTEIEFKETLAHSAEEIVQQTQLDAVIDVWELTLQAARDITTHKHVPGMISAYHSLCKLYGFDPDKLHARLMEHYRKQLKK